MAITTTIPTAHTICFRVFRLYRGMWRYFGVRDVLAVLQSVMLGTLLGVLLIVLRYRFEGYSRALFVVEAMSVIIQVLYFKRTGKRVFLMAPIHHHFEKLGWAEPQIVIRFWIIALILAMIGLATLKVR